MQKTIVDLAFLCFFVFLFGALSQWRRDVRLRYWAAGWFFLVPHFAIELWQPGGPLGRLVQDSISIDALALTGTCFIVSAAMTCPHNRLIGHLGLLLTIVTLVVLDMAVAGAPGWLLAGAVAGRQLLAIGITRTPRPPRPALALTITALCELGAIWMFEGIFSGHPEIVIYAILAEIFLVAAADVWTAGWTRSLPLRIVAVGLVAWGAVFPVAYGAAQLWPGVLIESEFWNIPKVCVSVGMILIVFEDENRRARALTKDYRLLFDSNPQALWITEIATLRFLDANQAAFEMHGYTREEFLNLRMTDVLHEEEREEALRLAAGAHLVQHRASRHHRKDGTVFSLDVSARDVMFHDKPCRFVMAVDVSEREALEEQLTRQAGQDPLTCLPNRMRFPELLAGALTRAIESEEKLAVLSIDIDRFKRVNDFYGLRVGDEYIRRMAATLAGRMRSLDIIARTGGDEFSVVLTGLKGALTAEQMVDEIQAIFAEPMMVQGYRVQLPVWIGAAIGPDRAHDAIGLWRGAESARLRAKAAGAGHVMWLSEELSREAAEQFEIESYLRSHLNDGGFRLVYQPLYAYDGMVRGLEALMRLDHPTLGPISPARLIPIAEEAGQIIALGQWALDEVCRQLLVWRSQQVACVPVAINVSGLELMHVDFARRLLATLERYSIDPHLIHLEVTESVAMHHLTEANEQMAELAKHGILFSIDDFGTGHSSLARLAELGVSVLKIDRSFISPGCSDHAHSIVQAIITMAHTLGHTVVAEGVETRQQVECLGELGCDLLQGFLLSRPARPGEIPALLSEPHPVLAEHAMRGAPALRLVARGAD